VQVCVENRFVKLNFVVLITAVTTYRVGEIWQHQLTFLLVTLESIDKIP